MPNPTDAKQAREAYRKFVNDPVLFVQAAQAVQEVLHSEMFDELFRQLEQDGETQRALFCGRVRSRAP